MYGQKSQIHKAVQLEIRSILLKSIFRDFMMVTYIFVTIRIGLLQQLKTDGKRCQVPKSAF